jgi:hypothetical protein
MQDRLVPKQSLRAVFLLMAAWDVLGGIVQLIFNGFLFKLNNGGDVTGLLAARAFSGALFVTAALYVIAALNPIRYRFILWLGVVEQLIAICTGVFHGARSDVSWGGVVLPIAVAMTLLILLLMNYPRLMSGEMLATEESAEPESEGEPPPEQK